MGKGGHKAERKRKRLSGKSLKETQISNADLPGGVRKPKSFGRGEKPKKKHRKTNS